MTKVCKLDQLKIVIANQFENWCGNLYNKCMLKHYWVYIMTNKTNAILYTGVTNNLLRRVAEHKHKLSGGFTAHYNVNKLIYYESSSDVNAAIAREKQIKAGSRKKKIELIESFNPLYEDLYQKLLLWQD